jgi:hypothetical protein
MARKKDTKKIDKNISSFAAFIVQFIGENQEQIKKANASSFKQIKLVFKFLWQALTTLPSELVNFIKDYIIDITFVKFGGEGNHITEKVTTELTNKLMESPELQGIFDTMLGIADKQLESLKTLKLDELGAAIKKMSPGAFKEMVKLGYSNLHKTP